MTAKRVETLAEGVTLYLGDCRDVISSLPPSSVDMIWTDPPYGHSNHEGDLNARLNEHRVLESQPIAFDDPEGMRIVVDGMLKEAIRVLNDDCCCCCCCSGGGPRPTFAWVADRMDRDGLSFFHSVIWDKRNPGLGWRYRRRHEMVMVAHKQGGKLLWADDKIASPNIVDVFPPRERVHPNEKPVRLVSHFLELHSLEGQLILDPFMGSGTTGVAAVSMGRRFIGIELDKAHFETSLRRINEELKRPRIFQSSAPPSVQEAFL